MGTWKRRKAGAKRVNFGRSLSRATFAPYIFMASLAISSTASSGAFSLGPGAALFTAAGLRDAVFPSHRLDIPARRALLCRE